LIPVRTIQEGPQFPPGSTSYEVELLQRALVRAGFDPGPVDGGFLPGSATAIAVRAFQAANGLAANGIVGPDTWEALPDEDMQGLPGLQLGSEGGAVALLQRCLRRMGFYFGPINGVFDAQTDASLRQQRRPWALWSMAPSEIRRGASWVNGRAACGPRVDANRLPDARSTPSR
jgi:peptidoglycan hydrolase-like protein with peptidoglycan-binding domain